MSMPDVSYPEIIWPKVKPTTPLTPPAAYEELKADGVPQNPVAGVPEPLIPDDDLDEPGVPPISVDPSTGKPTLPQVPDTVKSVTGDKLKVEQSGWMKELKQFGNLPELGTSFKKGLLSAVPTAIAGANASFQQVKIANTVGLGVIDMQNFKALEPTLRIALENKDEAARAASKARILAALPSMQGLPYGVRGTSQGFVERAFDDPTFLDSMRERSKFRYSPFTDPILQVAIEMQENIDERNPQDTSFVNSWADKVGGVGGSIASFLLARKAGGRVGLDAFAVYSGQGEAYQRALEAGADPEIAFKASSLGGFLGLTDVLPIERLVASPKVTRALFALAISAGKQAMVEGLQEGFQTYMANVIAKTLYKPDQDVSEGVWEATVLGAIGGVGADLATGGFRAELDKTPQVAPPPEFKGPSSSAIPPAPGAPEKPVEPVPPVAAPIAPVTGEPAKPAAPIATAPAIPAPMKVGEISKLPPEQRAIEADYVMAHDFNLIEPIQTEIAAGTPPADISAKLAPIFTPVTEFLARKGVTDAADIRLELDGMVRSIVAKLSAGEVTAAMAPTTWWHGSPSGDLRGGSSGLHLGTREAAKQALEARIGIPAVGEWDGTKEFGKTMLAGKRTMRERGLSVTGYNVNAPEEDYFPTTAPTYGDATPVDMAAKPSIKPFRLKGPMTNTGLPHEDFKANGYMAAALKRGNAKSGYFYRQVGEDEGSISIVVPSAAHVEPIEGDQDGQGTEDTTAALDAGGKQRRRGDRGEEVLREGDRLPGLPEQSPGPNQRIVDAAKAYLEARGLQHRRQSFHVFADPERGKRIADAYDAMPHKPSDPEVAAAYEAMINEVKAQYQAVLDMGLVIEMIQPGQENPYSVGPKQVFDDLKKNHLWFYPSLSGFGTINEITDNPLLTPTEFKVGEHVMVANDLFRVVHDVFGHGLEGSGFGPSGEENAFQAHVRMFTPIAARAMTSETRGQNSWVNFGPFGEANRANQKETVYADQKTGLMPEWTTTDGIVDDVEDVSALVSPGEQVETQGFKNWFEGSKIVDEDGNPMVVYHVTKGGDFTEFRRSPDDIGMHFGTAGQAEARFMDTATLRVEGSRLFTDQNQKPATMPVFLSIKNPLRLRDQGTWRPDREFKADLEQIFPEDSAHIKIDLETTEDVRKFLISKGYDGVVYGNTAEKEGRTQVSDEVKDIREKIDLHRERKFRSKDDSATLTTLETIRMREEDELEQDLFQQLDEAISELDLIDNAEELTDSYIAFDPRQIKSAIGNSGMFDAGDPNISAATPLKTKGARHAYIHERIRPAAGIKHTVMVNGQSIVDIVKAFKKAIDLVVQVGRFDRGHSTSEGIFKWGQSVARVKTESDLTTLFHEGGHHLHQLIGKPLDDLINKHFGELENIALQYYGGGGVIDPKDKKLVRREGFAHFFQAFINNPLAADAIAPGFAPDFIKLLDAEQPGVRKALGEVVKAVETHVTQKSSMQVALEHVSTGQKPGFVGRMVEAMRDGNLMHEIGTLINRAYMGMVGSEFPLQNLVHELARVAENNYRVLYERGEITKDQLQIALDKLAPRGKRNPVAMYWAAKNSAMRSAEFLHGGVQKFNTTDYKPVSKGFAEIMANVTGDARGHLYDELVHSFDAYLMARRMRSERQNFKLTMDWLRHGKQGPPPPVQRMQDPDSSFSEGDTNQSIADFEAQFPQFAQAATDVYGFLRAMVEYRRDAGDFTKEEADYMLAFVDYVPVHRVIEDTKRLSGAGQNVDGKSNGIKQFKGSGRQVISPLRSIWQMTHQQIALSMTNEMKLATVNMALDIGQGTGALIEKIPDTAMKGTVVNLSEILKAAGHIDTTGVEFQGTDMFDLAELADEIMSGDETATIWRPGDINEKGEHIVYVRRKGKREAYKLNDPAWADDLYRTLTDLAPPQRTMLIHVLSAPARALRWGVVTEPIYQLANIIRDGFTTMVLEPGTLPFQVVGKGIKNHIYRSQMKQLYNLSGTTIAGREIEKLDARKFGIERGRLQRMGINLQDVPLAGGVAAVVRTFYSSEALGRQGLFARAYERALKDGLSPPDALTEAGYTTTDYANYGRGGSRMAEMRAVVPFLGAAIQGLDKATRASFGGPAIPALMRKKLEPWLNRMLRLEGTKTSLPLSQVEADAFKYSMKVQAAMLTLGVASMLLDSKYWGDEEYEQFSPYMRGTRWLFKIGPGQWLGIPKPFQYAFYSTLFSYGLDAVYKGDTTAMMKFLESQLYVTMVPYENPGIALGYELAFNKDLFSGRDIVPQNLEARPWRMQSDIYTSQLGKGIAKVTGLSPMIIDHVITSSFATWGRSALALSNLTDTSRPQQGLEDFAFTRYFIKNGSRSTTVKPAFWNLVGQSTGNLVGAYGAYRDLVDAGAIGQAQQYLSGATDDERVYAYLNYHQKAEAKKLHPLRNANDMVTALNAMRKEITASNFKMDGGDGERLVLSPTIQRQLNDRLSALGIREMRNALVITDQPGFGGKAVMPTLSIYKEIEGIDGRVARELKNRLGSKVYSFDAVRKLWPQVRTEILLNGENAKLTPFVSQARAGGRKYFTEGDPL